MEILGIGPLELLFILLIALIAVGPRDLGKAARSTGRMLNQLYKSEAWAHLSEASRNLRSLPNRLAREAALEELDDVKRELEEGVNRGVEGFKQAGQSVAEAVDPQPQESRQPIDDRGTATQETAYDAADQAGEDPSPEGS